MLNGSPIRFDLGGGTAVNFDIRSWTAYGGVDRVVLQFSGVVESEPPSAVAGHGVVITGEAWFSGDVSRAGYSGVVRHKQPVILPSAGDQHVRRDLQLQTEIGRGAFADLEDLRNGRGVELRLDLVATIAPGPHGDTAWSADRFATGSGYVRFEAADWARVLEQIGYSDVLTLTVPLTPPSAAGALADAERSLSLAQSHLVAAQFKDAVAVVREATEALLKERPVESGPQAERSKAQRYAAVAQAIHQLVGGAHHKDAILESEWQRDDAKAAIGLLASLLGAW